MYDFVISVLNILYIVITISYIWMCYISIEYVIVLYQHWIHDCVISAFNLWLFLDQHFHKIPLYPHYVYEIDISALYVGVFLYQHCLSVWIVGNLHWMLDLLISSLYMRFGDINIQLYEYHNMLWALLSLVLIVIQFSFSILLVSSIHS